MSRRKSEYIVIKFFHRLKITVCSKIWYRKAQFDCRHESYEPLAMLYVDVQNKNYKNKIKAAPWDDINFRF